MPIASSRREQITPPWATPRRFKRGVRSSMVTSASPPDAEPERPSRSFKPGVRPSRSAWSSASAIWINDIWEPLESARKIVRICSSSATENPPTGSIQSGLNARSGVQGDQSGSHRRRGPTNHRVSKRYRPASRAAARASSYSDRVMRRLISLYSFSETFPAG